MTERARARERAREREREREKFIDNQIDDWRSVSTTPLQGDTAAGHSWPSIERERESLSGTILYDRDPGRTVTGLYFT
jgi:hypothetical protein